MDHYKYVISEHLNHYGTLYGGNLLKWIDEIGYITASIEYPDCRFVTVALKDVEFRHRIQLGAVLVFSVNNIGSGNSSVTYNVKVFSAIDKMKDTVLFETDITFVNVDENGNKVKIIY
ncbi:MAG: acyl-CoA thioesterase [Pseudomonadota bacterium]